MPKDRKTDALANILQGSEHHLASGAASVRLCGLQDVHLPVLQARQLQETAAAASKAGMRASAWCRPYLPAAPAFLGRSLPQKSRQIRRRASFDPACHTASEIREGSMRKRGDLACGMRADAGQMPRSPALVVQGSPVLIETGGPLLAHAGKV